MRLNRRRKLIGYVLSGRFKAQLVDGSGNGYLRTACDKRGDSGTLSAGDGHA